MSSVLITGGLGYVGGRLSQRLARDFNVIVSTRQVPDSSLLKVYGEIQVVNHSDLLIEARFPKNIKTVIHMAALNEIDCVQYPSEAIHVNIDQTRQILDNAIKNGVENFIYFSTAHVYGSPLVGLIDETSLPAPIHPYSITHKCAEDYIHAAVRQKKIHGIIFRLSNSFGAPVSPKVNRWTLLANDLARQAVEKGKLTLYSNGCQHRDFICLRDVENIIHTILINETKKYNKLIYNLGSGKSLRVGEMAEKIVAIYYELFGRKLDIQFPAGSEFPKEPELIFSNERLKNENINIEDDIDTELKNLLLFCYDNYSVSR